RATEEKNYCNARWLSAFRSACAATELAPPRGSPKDAGAFSDATLEHHLNGALHLIDARTDGAILFVGIAAEFHRLAEIDAVLHRKWQEAEGAKPWLRQRYRESL